MLAERIERAVECISLKPGAQAMKASWFKPLGWFYVQASTTGFVLSFSAAMFCLMVFIAVDRKSHSASDTLYGIFPFFACTFLLLDWIGRRTSAVNATEWRGESGGG